MATWWVDLKVEMKVELLVHQMAERWVLTKVGSMVVRLVEMSASMLVVNLVVQ
jgi:hypothetical protein